MRADVYTRVTDKIVNDLERGVRPWLKPWNTVHAAGRITRPLRANGQAYKGINVLMLWCEASEKGYACPIWMTYRQAQELKGQVRKGERGSQVVYADRIKRTETDDNGEELEREIPFLKGYTVFNCEQIEGLPAHFYATATPPASPLERIAAAERFAAGTGATVRHGGNRAYYSITDDYVQMPPFECFRDAEAYYATLLHELTHWTRHVSRLDRNFGRKRWGDAGYAAEELVAELGAAFLSADLDITAEPRDDHSSYLATWLEVLKSDKRAIFTAAAHAQRAADFLNCLQPKPLEATSIETGSLSGDYQLGKPTAKYSVIRA
ncbi:MAG: ArdC family protein [Alphaproteobacteria bacterium]